MSEIIISRLVKRISRIKVIVFVIKYTKNKNNCLFYRLFWLGEQLWSLILPINTLKHLTFPTFACKNVSLSSPHMFLASGANYIVFLWQSSRVLTVNSRNPEICCPHVLMGRIVWHSLVYFFNFLCILCQAKRT